LQHSLTNLRWEDAVKASPNWATQLQLLNPKPGELTLSRLSPPEMGEEDRTRDRSNDLR